MNPPKRITDPNFRYVKSTDTNLRKTFARVRREMAEEKKVMVIVPLKQVK